MSGRTVTHWVSVNASTLAAAPPKAGPRYLSTDPAEGGVGLVAHGLLVDVDLAGVDPVGELHRRPDVSEDADRQPVLLVVDDRAASSRVEKEMTGGDGAEISLAPRRHLGRQAGQDGGAVAGAVDLAASGDLRAPPRRCR